MSRPLPFFRILGADELAVVRAVWPVAPDLEASARAVLFDRDQERASAF